MISWQEKHLSYKNFFHLLKKKITNLTGKKQDAINVKGYPKALVHNLSLQIKSVIARFTNYDKCLAIKKAGQHTYRPEHNY